MAMKGALLLATVLVTIGLLLAPAAVCRADRGARTADTWCVGVDLWTDLMSLLPAGADGGRVQDLRCPPATVRHDRRPGVLVGQRCTDATVPRVCPACGSRHIVPIVWGYPSDAAVARAVAGEVILGGCLVDEASPDWCCRACGHAWIGAPAVAIQVDPDTAGTWRSLTRDW